MADYKKMYLTLLQEMDNTIERFKNKLNEAEDIYIETEDAVNDENSLEKDV